MKILLTGCDGQVGWEVCRQAKALNLEVVPTDIANLDITNIDAVRAIQSKEKADIFINSAAYTAVDKAESDQPLAYAVNATGAKNLAIVASETNAPILHISTDYIFSGNSSVPYQEGDEPDPTGVYGETKLAGERQVEAANDKFVTLRTSWVFGIEGQNFVKTMLRLARERDELTVVADQFGSPTFAGHIAAALLALTKQYEAEGVLPWGNYNFCDSGPTTWHGFANNIMKVGVESGVLDKSPIVRPLRSEDYPTLAARPGYSVMDCSLFLKTFPEIGISSWEAGLREMIGSARVKAEILGSKS
jgi:dTDP-4-dehydrorhamnose reductase